MTAKKRTPVYVEHYGALFRLSQRNFSRLKTAINKQEEWDLSALGTLVNGEFASAHNLEADARADREDI